MEENVPFRKRDEIESIAESVLKEHGMLDAPIDPIRVAHAMRVRILNATFSEDSISGMITRRGPNITMLINVNDSANRKRFTIAHELGHRILEHFPEASEHTDHNTDLFRDGGEQAGSNRAEVQANMFASSLLMPRVLVKKYYAQSPDIDQLAKRFHVSSEAMGHRLSSLGLLA